MIIVSKATKHHCAGTVQSQGGRVRMLNRWVLRRDRKTATEGAEVTRSGSLFQMRAVATRKSSVTDGRQLGAADNQR